MTACRGHATFQEFPRRAPIFSLAFRLIGNSCSFMSWLRFQCVAVMIGLSMVLSLEREFFYHSPQNRNRKKTVETTERRYSQVAFASGKTGASTARPENTTMKSSTFHPSLRYEPLKTSCRDETSQVNNSLALQQGWKASVAPVKNYITP